MKDSSATIRDVAKKFSREDFFGLLTGSGRAVKSGLCQCPLEGCRDRGPKKLDGRVHQGKHVPWVFSCHHCNQTVDYVDLYRTVHDLALPAALDALRDFTPAPSKAPLRLVRGPVLQTADGKLTADQVRKFWAELTPEDDAGEAYLEGRRLREAASLGYVRFATDASESSTVRSKAKSGYRVAMLLADLAGRPLGVQFRTVVRGVDPENTKRTLKGSYAKGVYFGRPADVLGARCVVVAEGMADSLAALLWVKNEPATAVVGVPGASFLPALADAVDDAGVDVNGQLWVLLAQHDVGPRGNTSLNAFMQLKAKLLLKGADVVMENAPPGEVKDWAESWQRQHLEEWPPTQVKRYLGGNSAAGDTAMSRAQGAAIWHSDEPLDPGFYGKDLTSLTHLLSADPTRVAICGQGEWRLNEMTDEVEYGGQALGRGDYTRIRLNIEGFKGSMDNKRLRFPELDIRAVAHSLAERRRYSPVRDYLERLAWDNVQRIGEGLPKALGLDEQSQGLEAEYLRRWLIAAVARAFEPGCQVDSMLVLQGKEGEHKSRFFEEMGGKWYVSTSAELGTINAIETLRRGWLIELDEMDAVTRTREFSSVKAFITRASDVYCPKYVREAVTVKRASVLGGTVNHEDFLIDEDGLRRFWVIPVRARIDRAWVREHRDQLWAEAVHLYRAKHRWHLEPEQEELRREANRRFVKEDPWQPLVVQHLHDETFNDFFRVELVLGQVLQIQPRDQDQAGKNRVARIFKELGFTPEMRSEGKHGRFRGWARPKGATP